MTRAMRRAAFSATALACLLSAAACSSGKDRNLSATTAPRQVTAKPAGGSAGIGPLTVSNPTSTGGPCPNGHCPVDDQVGTARGRRSMGGRRCGRTGLHNLRQPVREFLVEPDPVLRVHVEAVMRMTATWAVVEGERPAADREGAERVLQRVIEPDEVVLVGG